MLPDAETPRLETPRLVVRPASEADAAAVARFYRENREFLRPWEPRRPEAFFTEPFWEEQVALARGERVRGASLRAFLFSREAPGEVVGTANLTAVTRGAFHAARLGYALAERAEGRGLMREALAALIDHAFGPMNLHRIEANHLPRNERSARLLASLGFVREGVARDYLRIDGRWEDHVLTSLTNPAWREEEG